MEFTLAQDKAFNAFVYFAERIKPLYLTKAIKLLYLADKMAVKQTGVPITWLNYKVLKLGPVPEDIYCKVKLLAVEKAFDDSQFSDYDIEVLDYIIKAYGKLNFAQKSNQSDFIIELMELLDTDFKRSAFEVAYETYLMQNEICGVACSDLGL